MECNESTAAQRECRRCGRKNPRDAEAIRGSKAGAEVECPASNGQSSRTSSGGGEDTYSFSQEEQQEMAGDFKVRRSVGCSLNGDLTAAERLLQDSIKVVRERRSNYGNPAEHFTRTVNAINAIFADKLKEPFTPSDWAQVMLLDKLARHNGTAKSTDTPIDLAGYAACLAECEEVADVRHK